MIFKVLTYNRMFFNKALIFAFICFTFNAISQNKKEKLQKEKSKIEKDIAYTNKLLNETKKNTQASLNQVIILKSKIEKREKLITNINSEIYDLDQNILNNISIIQKLTQDLKNLKDDYAKMIYFAYKNKSSYDKLMFIFASKDFNQAYLRLKYLQQYSENRKKQAENIINTKLLILKKVNELEAIRSGKKILLGSKEKEKRNLASEKEEKDQTIAKLKQKEKELLKTLKDKEEAAKKLQKAIEDVIAEEIRLAAEKAKKKGKTSTKGKITLTPDEVKLSSSFNNNKGKLPWPSEKGIVSITFGEHPHPILPGIKTKNNGIDISTNEGSYARTIFDGVVTRVFSIPGSNQAVIVRHGDYFTVYSNLDLVLVKMGDNIKTKQNIGVVHTNSDEGKTELHLEIWNGRNILNPLDWLLDK